ncbi:hypothetical protein TWF506_003504 [Arthrobotrys conoides]|uniref:Secreted protein n=1 Tax=Arthrobotrys conoides TaxID=74498 RepID=A0AAN8NCT5_9PEZI
MLAKKLVIFTTFTASLAFSEIQPREATTGDLILGLEKWAGAYSKNARYIGNLQFSDTEEFTAGEIPLWLTTVNMMNSVAEEVSIYAEEFEKYWRESPISEHAGREIAKVFKTFCDKQCQYFGRLVALRSKLEGLEKAPFFHELEKNMDSCLANVEGAQAELYVSIEDAVSADKTRDSKAILLNVNNAYDIFTVSILEVVSAWKERPESPPCTRAV